MTEKYVCFVLILDWMFQAMWYKRCRKKKNESKWLLFENQTLTSLNAILKEHSKADDA